MLSIGDFVSYLMKWFNVYSEISTRSLKIVVDGLTHVLGDIKVVKGKDMSMVGINSEVIWRVLLETYIELSSSSHINTDTLQVAIADH